MKPLTSYGHDQITSKLLKQIKFGVAAPLTILINKSLSSGEFPEKLKLTKVRPIHKGKEQELATNYRPISLLSSVSKIFEKIMMKRMTKFFNDNRILTPHQYGFRKNHSTMHAITELHCNILEALINNQMTLSVFIDLSKAFDRIDHRILLNKLYSYGIRGKPLNWISSYLKDRSIYVCCNKYESSLHPLQATGVPQGSVLGPLLFLLYVNDLFECLHSSKAILFADDTTIYIKGSNIETLFNQLNNDLSQLSTWCYNNKLLINPQKTKYMLFSRRYNNMTTPPPKLTLNSQPIERVRTTKFLGIYLDEQLNWSEHLNHIRLRISHGLYILNKVKNNITPSLKRNLYFAIIHSHLSYGCFLWGNTHKKSLKPILTLQKKAIRIIAGAKYNSHTATLLKKHNILTVNKIYSLQINQFMHKFLSFNLPPPLLTFFSKYKTSTTHDTRHHNVFTPPQTSLQLVHSSVLFMGPKLWMNNHLPLPLSLTYSSFTRLLKQTLVHH